MPPQTPKIPGYELECPTAESIFNCLTGALGSKDALSVWERLCNSINRCPDSPMELDDLRLIADAMEAEVSLIRMIGVNLNILIACYEELHQKQFPVDTEVAL